jgi:hypothetical protein
MARFSQLYTDYIINGWDVGGGTWADKRRRYWRTWWTRKRCLVCCRRSTRRDLHHLHYNRLGRESLLDLRPLCHSPCHKIVTATSKALRAMAIKQPTLKATYLVWFCARLPLLACVWWSATSV